MIFEVYKGLNGSCLVLESNNLGYRIAGSKLLDSSLVARFQVSDSDKKQLQECLNQSLLDKLHEFESYEDDWDSEGSPAPSKETIECFRQLIPSLNSNYDFCLATVNGEIQIEYANMNIIIDGKDIYIEM